MRFIKEFEHYDYYNFVYAPNKSEVRLKNPEAIAATNNEKIINAPYQNVTVTRRYGNSSRHLYIQFGIKGLIKHRPSQADSPFPSPDKDS